MRVRTKIRRVDDACKGGAVEQTELLAVEPSSKGLWEADRVLASGTRGMGFKAARGWSDVLA